jgi:LysR family glycine cleavage system transcriptional activator
MLIDAAIDGQGVVLARTTLAAWDPISGRVVRPFDLSWQPTGTYWIVSQKAMAKVEKIRRFRDWLLTEAADDVQRLSERQRGR